MAREKKAKRKAARQGRDPEKRGRGRPPRGGVRRVEAWLTESESTALDAYQEEQGLPSTAEAIRDLIRKGTGQ